ncbi:MAG: RnfABCDGE type electron transport complex subunit B [Ruminococcus bicirculans (ex Wegman et al. 2014)]
MEYLIPLAIFAALGILAGVLLTVASKVFAVEVDERVDAIAEALPQANCGACGFSGCADYADAIVNKGAECNLCRPGGEAAAKKIAEIMGVEVTVTEPQVAFVRCSEIALIHRINTILTAFRAVRRATDFMTEASFAQVAV